MKIYRNIIAFQAWGLKGLGIHSASPFAGSSIVLTPNTSMPGMCVSMTLSCMV